MCHNREGYSCSLRLALRDSNIVEVATLGTAGLSLPLVPNRPSWEVCRCTPPWAREKTIRDWRTRCGKGPPGASVQPLGIPSSTSDRQACTHAHGQVTVERAHRKTGCALTKIGFAGFGRRVSALSPAAWQGQVGGGSALPPVAWQAQSAPHLPLSHRRPPMAMCIDHRIIHPPQARCRAHPCFGSLGYPGFRHSPAPGPDQNPP